MREYAEYSASKVAASAALTAMLPEARYSMYGRPSTWPISEPTP